MACLFDIREPAAYKRFSLPELFGQPELSKSLRREDFIDGDIPIVSAGFINCGISDYISNGGKIYENCLTIDPLGFCMYRGYKFYASSIYIVDNDAMSARVKEYVAVCITAALDRYCFTDRFNLNAYNNTYIELPVTDAGELDIEYMSSYMEHIFDIQHKKVSHLLR